MTIEDVKLLLEKDVKNHFVVYTNEDREFKDMPDNVMVLAGEDEIEVFNLYITKV